ncbi:hypothetical protein ASG60_12305 [Methylobacterium sp. Leaf469]|uniref:hypothetical protein n=1 Tax=Methylobacterium sp. Leaf469 TaxID=1736387 RepID=UPI0006FA15AF|nr:hypothetical protein [Methylobacterium sp. Leaf469]KQT87823.1 hypothetical protein ASG60_12305 [Methylobacterium sp. Leaf469]
MTVLKLSAFPAAFRTNLLPLSDVRLRAVRSRSTRKAAPKSPPKKKRDANVALIMAVMMSLVFAPVVGMHLFATFGPVDLGTQKPAAEVVSRTVPALPPS